jgi:Fe-S oxidoreductase/nitrate reductase gamma subunit
MTAETLPQTAEKSPPSSPGRTKLIWSGTRDFFVQILGQGRLLKRIYPGVMHFLIFWGMIVLFTNHFTTLQQMPLFFPFEFTFPRENLYLAFELGGDIAGLAVLLGLLMAIFRRLVLRPDYLKTSGEDYFVLIFLTFVPILGYFNEAVRLVAVSPEWENWSFVGNWLADILRGWGMTPEIATAWHGYMLLIHVGFGLTAMVVVPLTKLRHIVFSPWNILVRSRRKAGVLETIEDIENAEILGAGEIGEFNTKNLLSFDACTNCGRCESVCPATISGSSYSPRDLIQTLHAAIQHTLVKPSKENGSHPNVDFYTETNLWGCTTCGHCIAVCPVFINPVDQVVELRRNQILTTGQMPKSIGDTLRNMERQGNPWGMPPQERARWTEGLNVPKAEPGKEFDVLLYLGCSMAFDERNKKIAQAIVELLQRNKVDFAYLGLDEACCGETARRMGHEYVFQVMAEENIAMFSELNFKRIVTPCPHCLNTLVNEYPKFGGDYEVIHITEFLQSLSMDIGKVSLSENGRSPRVIYHDPCYLGRYNDVYSAPRALLDSAEVNRGEMKRNKANSFCCGGGGGHMWLEADAEVRVNHRRLEEALDAGAEVVATACPYCLTMFADAINSKGLGDQIQVMDISEILVKK